MSAFYCSPLHIGIIASHTNYPTSAARTLAKANIKAMHTRYGDSEKGSPFGISEAQYIDQCGMIAYSLTGTGKTVSFPISKLVDCFEYQAMEIKNWHRTKAYRIIQSLRRLPKIDIDPENSNWVPWSI